jgi:hypothetical protein
MFKIREYSARTAAVSLPQAVSRAKGMYVKNVLGHAPNTTAFRIAIRQMQDVAIAIHLDPLARQRFSELYREQYQLSITDLPTQVEFVQLEDIVNKLSNT